MVTISMDRLPRILAIVGTVSLAMIPAVIIGSEFHEYRTTVMPMRLVDYVWPYRQRTTDAARFWLIVAGLAWVPWLAIRYRWLAIVNRHRPVTFCLGMAAFVFFGPLITNFSGRRGRQIPDWGWDDLLWPHHGRIIEAAVFWLLLGGVIWLLQRLFGHARFWSKGYASPTRGRRTIDLFGHSILRPAFLDRDRGVFTWNFRPTIYYTDHRGQTQSADLFGMGTPTVRNELLRLESLIESARLERHKRGHRVDDRSNRMIMPDLTDAGVVVEQVEEDDATIYVLAVDVGRELIPSEYMEAERLGIGRPRGAWRRHPPTALRHHNAKSVPLVWNATTPGMMALFKVDLQTIRVPIAAMQSDPLAPPSVEHGGARFAWPIPSEGPPE